MQKITDQEKLVGILHPDDSRYYNYQFPFDLCLCLDNFLALVNSNALNVFERKIPSLPMNLADMDKVLAFMCPLDKPSLYKEIRQHNKGRLEIKNFIFRSFHHQREESLEVARVLTKRYFHLYTPGYRMRPNPWYSGYKADVGLINPKGEVVIVVEVGNVGLGKVFTLFADSLKEFWLWGWEGIYYVVKRGSNWRQGILFPQRSITLKYLEALKGQEYSQETMLRILANLMGGEARKSVELWL